MMLSPRETVLATPELLESILFHLPPQHLVQANLISRNFHNTILSSPKLQHILHLRPNLTAQPQKWTINPLLRGPFLPFFVLPSDRYHGLPDYDSFQQMDWVKTRSEAFLREETSWRHMFITQPPSKSLEVVRSTSTQGGTFRERVNIPIPFPASSPTSRNQDPSEDYVTMGLIYDIVEEFLVETDGSFGKFCLFFEDSPAGPRVKLRLEWVVQCCPTHSVGHKLRSRAAYPGVGFDAMMRAWSEDGEEQGGDAELEAYVNERNALTEEKGGAIEWVWKEWKRQRAGIGELMADVRGG